MGDQHMTTELTDSDCFALLADRRRRIIVRALRDGAAALSTEELAERIADRECERERERPTEDHLRTVRIALAHNHLPRLEDRGVVSYDRDERTVSLRPKGVTLADYLARVADGTAGPNPNAFHAGFRSWSSRRR